MKKLICLFFILAISKLSYTQVNTLNHLDLKDTIFDVPGLKKFITDDFVVFTATQIELLETDHPIRQYNFNRVINDC